MEHISRGQLLDILLSFERSAYQANEEGRIFAFLREHGISYEEEDEFPYDRRKVKILIAGASMIDVRAITRLLKEYGIDPERVDTVLEYDELQKYRWSALQYSQKYSDVIVGPMGHSSVGAGDYSSVITRMESEDGWPNVVRATANQEIKITKNSLKEALIKTLFYKKIVQRA